MMLVTSFTMSLMKIAPRPSAALLCQLQRMLASTAAIRDQEPAVYQATALSQFVRIPDPSPKFGIHLIGRGDRYFEMPAIGRSLFRATYARASHALRRFQRQHEPLLAGCDAGKRGSANEMDRRLLRVFVDRPERARGGQQRVIRRPDRRGRLREVACDCG